MATIPMMIWQEQPPVTRRRQQLGKNGRNSERYAKACRFDRPQLVSI
jgi:hypothetical protein